jgi:DNA-binding FrmR family transcriptional regulator
MAVAKKPVRKQQVDPHRRPLDERARRDLLNRLKTSRGHIDSVVASLDGDPYMIDVLQQLAAIRGSLDAMVRVGLRYYCENAFVPALRAGEVDAAVEELLEALAFLKQLA